LLLKTNVINFLILNEIDINKKIKKEVYKPGSVFCFHKTSTIYLGFHLRESSINLPIAILFFNKGGEPLHNCNLFGLSTPEVFLPAMLPRQGVSSYLTFSPLLCKSKAVYFLWHCLSSVFAESLAFTRRNALCCPDFPPLISERR
jgi:hypothetical protein